MIKTLLPLAILMAFTATTHAKMIDGLALIVEGKAVTTAEIHAVETQMNVSKKEAINLLIQDRLQAIAMRGINISEKAIDKKIALIATRNNVTVPQMQEILNEQGTPWAIYRNSIRDGLTKEKFYLDKMVAKTPNPTQEEIKIYYRNHKDLFSVPKSISLVEYSTSSKKKMEKFLHTNKTSYVKARKMTKSAKSFKPALLDMLLRTENGHYTQVINTGNKYIIYKVKSKHGKTSLSFKKAKGMVIGKWKQTQQNKALKDYFKKLRTSADIQIVR